MIEGHSQHGGRRGLAMRTRDRDSLRLVEQRRIDIRTMHLFDAQPGSFDHFRIIIPDGGGNNDGIHPMHMCSGLSLIYPGSQLFELFHDL